MLRMCFSLLLLCIASPAWATDRYVSTSGSGSSCSQGSPCSWTTARDATQPGDRIILFGGTYDMSLDGIPGGNSSSRVTIEAFQGHTSIVRRVDFDSNSYITMKRITVDGNFSNTFGDSCVRFANTHHIRLEDMEIRYNRYLGIFNSPNDPVSDIELIRLNVHNHGTINGESTCTNHPNLHPGICHGIYMSANNVLIEGGEVHHNDGWGIHLYPGPSNITVRGVRAHHNYTRHGIGVSNIYGGPGFKFYNNVSYRNAEHGIMLFSVNDAIIHHNTVYGNNDAGIATPSSSNNVLRNNLSCQNGGAGGYRDMEDDDFSSQYNPSSCPTFVSAPGDDYHLTGDDNGGVFLGGEYAVDIEGFPRSTPPDRGAHEFQDVLPPPGPIGNVARYIFEGNANDVATPTDPPNAEHNLSLVGNASLSSTTPIIGTQSLLLDGSGDYAQVALDASLKPSEHFGLAAWVNPTGISSGGGEVITGGDSYGLYLDGQRRPCVFWYNSSSWPLLCGTTPLPLNQNTHLAATKDENHLRLWANRIQAPALASTGTINYALGTTLRLGRHGTTDTTRDFNGRIDNVYVHANTYYDQGYVDNLFNELPPVEPPSIASMHCLWTAAHAPEGTFINPVPNQDHTQILTIPLGRRCKVESSGISLAEHLRWFATRNGGAFVEVTDAFNTAGVRYLADSVVSMGQNTTAFPGQIPAGAYTFVAGEFYEAPVNTGVQITLLDGQYTEVEGRFELGSPLVPGDTLQLRLHRANGSAFGAEHYGTCPGAGCSTRTLTLAAPPSTLMRGGGAWSGGRIGGP